MIPLGLVDSSIAWQLPDVDNKPNLLMDDAMYVGGPGSPLGLMPGMRTPMSLMTPPGGVITPTGTPAASLFGGVGGTDLYERWNEKGMFDP